MNSARDTWLCRQDRIEEQAAAVAELLCDKGAHVCVCGDG